ncbi:MAG: SRPBCC family protein [Actinomycetota bacterium]|nr:SRPBCC family protein [Actinomycetota bacterium]
MDVDVGLEAPCAPEALFAWVDDLGRYPRWLDLVPRAEPDAALDGDPGPAWVVDLRARLGPLSRSKRLRMVRTVHEPPRVARFQRLEHDGLEHSAWVLQATVEPIGETASRLTMHLHYSGGLFGPVLDKKLHDEVARCRPRLLGLVAGEATR